jgi:hypothetical protein
MKRFKHVFLVVAIIIVFVNLPVINDMVGYFDRRDCNYSDYTGKFTFSEMNFFSRDFDQCMENFKIFKQRNPDAVLYRHCKKNIFKFWNYKQYLFEDKYKLPYIDWREVSARRGAVENRSGLQDF